MKMGFAFNISAGDHDEAVRQLEAIKECRSRKGPRVIEAMACAPAASRIKWSMVRAHIEVSGPVECCSSGLRQCLDRCNCGRECTLRKTGVPIGFVPGCSQEK